MAAGFKTATVNAASVPATQTDMPSYVDLARIGITTLAEAESVRVYADSGKTTEWAREIVSVTEMHVKVPSLTSTVVMYVDWDGVRADYAVGDTFGRNAVWTGRTAQWHFNESSGNATDSKSSRVLTNTAVTYGAGQIGNSAIYNQTSSEGLHTTAATDFDFERTDPFTIATWVKRSSANTSNQMICAHRNYGATWHGYSVMVNTVGGVETIQVTVSANGGSSYTINTVGALSTAWSRLVITHSGSNLNTGLLIYINGALQSVTNVGTTASASIKNSERFEVGTWGNNSENRFRGNLDEFGVSPSVFSQNWITTEYNNQNAEATFWGTWTTVSGGSPAQAARRGVIMMM